MAPRLESKVGPRSSLFSANFRVYFFRCLPFEPFWIDFTSTPEVAPLSSENWDFIECKIGGTSKKLIDVKCCFKIKLTLGKDHTDCKLKHKNEMVMKFQACVAYPVDGANEVKQKLNLTTVYQTKNKLLVI